MEPIQEITREYYLKAVNKHTNINNMHEEMK